MVTHRYSIDEAQEAYEAAADEAGDASAVFLYPSGQARERGSSRLLSGGNLSGHLSVRVSAPLLCPSCQAREGAARALYSSLD